MTIDPRFSSTVPATLDALPEPASALAPIESARVLEFEVAAAAAVEFGAALGQLRRLLERLARDIDLSKEQLRPLEAALERGHRVTMHARLLARVAAGDVKPKPGQTDLVPMLRTALEARARQPQDWGRVEQDLTPAAVIVDRDIAAALIDALLDWTLGPGRQAKLTLHVKDWPAHALLQLHVTLPGLDEGLAEDHERLCWYLARELCRTIGATLDRVRSEGQILVMVEFPRTVREMDGVSAMEVDFGGSGHAADGGRVLAGHRALIISSDVKLREEAKRICQDMGLQVDNVPSSSLALQRCEQSRPDLVIVDERFSDERFEQLRTWLRAGNADFPLIEVVYATDAPLALSGWGSGGMTRIGRRQLASQLPQALALEMSKVL